MNPEKDKFMILDLLKFKDKIDYIISNSLKHEDCFVDVRKKAFEEFVNKRQNKPAELIAKFIDGKFPYSWRQFTSPLTKYTLLMILNPYNYRAVP